MEAILFALLALRNVYTSRETLVPEPYQFQPFDQQALRQVYRAKDKSLTQRADRQKSYVAHSVS